MACAEYVFAELRHEPICNTFVQNSVSAGKPNSYRQS